jgi:deazaflavin-dependent oxidoreductase (nitroreductase family)
MPLFGQEHVDRYRETAGEEGHDWQGTTVLLLTTTGRKSGAERITPLIYQRHGDDYLVVASNGGGTPPGWFLNLRHDPIVAVRVKADHHTARARVATAEEKPELWRIMTATGAPYDEFQARAEPRDPGGFAEAYAVLRVDAYLLGGPTTAENGPRGRHGQEGRAQDGNCRG